MRIFLLLGLFASALAEFETYEGYKLVEIVPNHEEELKTLEKWFLHSELDFWTEILQLHHPVHVFASAEQLDWIGEYYHYSVIDDDIPNRIQSEHERLMKKEADGEPFYDYADYNNYDLVVAEIYRLAASCPGKFTCEVRSIGTSVLGEDLLVLSITEPGAGKQAIWFDATIHAREWLATSTMMLTIRRLIEEYGSDPDATNAMDRFDFHILPVVNPDGYRYTFTNNRMWRKNRATIAGSSCLGVDLNRNFDYMWSVSGTSTNPCSETFHGVGAASEPEVKNQQTEVNRIQQEVQTLFAAVSIHTYGNYWLMPYGHQSGGSCATSPDYNDQYQLCDKIAKATMSVHGTTWRYGSICTTLYPASGNTIDYMYAVTGVKYSYLPELRGGRFDPPTSAIQPSFTEVWAGLKELFTHT